LERLIFSKVPLWVFVLTVLVSVLGMIGFGVLAYDHHNGPKRFGKLSSFVGSLSSAPENAWQDYRRGNPMYALRRGRFGDKTGWEISPNTSLTGYLLLSRYDGSDARHRIELVDLSTFETRFVWLPDPELLFEGVSQEGKDAGELARRTRALFRAIHPVPTDDGGLIVKDHQSPLSRIDACGAIVWRLDDAEYHHSTEPAPEGGYWVPSYADPLELDLKASADYLDDALVRVSEGGEVLERVSLTKSMVAAEMMPEFLTDITFVQVIDPIHLNDIQPVPGDGPYWSEGDVFVSLRHPSIIALVRPSSGEVLWWRRGPWMAQHDVDVIDDHTISVFSNNTYDAGRGGYIKGQSEVLFYDFETDEVTSPYLEASEQFDIATVSEGLSEILPDGSIVIEEENSGRILIISQENELLAEYVNRAEDGEIYRMGWSRYLDGAEGDALIKTLNGVSCQ